MLIGSKQKGVFIFQHFRAQFSLFRRWEAPSSPGRASREKITRPSFGFERRKLSI
jgi:hypothetical protein